jgi:hypothetical protein
MQIPHPPRGLDITGDEVPLNIDVRNNAVL